MKKSKAPLGVPHTPAPLTAAVSPLGNGWFLFWHPTTLEPQKVTRDELITLLGGSFLTAETDPVFLAWLLATPPLFAETDPVVGAVTGIPKSDGSGNISAATDGTDYLSALTGAPIPSTNAIAATGDLTPAVGTSGAKIRYISSAARTAALTVNTPTGTPVNGQELIFAILGDGTPRTLDFTTSTAFKVIATTLPTITAANKWTYVGCIYNSLDSKWHVLAVNQEL